MPKILSFIRDESGVTAVEYAVAGALVAAPLVGSFTELGQTILALIVSLADVIAP